MTVRTRYRGLAFSRISARGLRSTSEAHMASPTQPNTMVAATMPKAALRCHGAGGDIGSGFVDAGGICRRRARGGLGSGALGRLAVGLVDQT